MLRLVSDANQHQPAPHTWTIASKSYAALTTLLERMQRVQTLMRFTPPLITARTD
jgi:hypothetical protein